MRKLALAAALTLVGTSAEAATIVIVTDPMTLDRQTFVLDSKGPSRVLMCMAPPSVSGCTLVPLKRPSSARR